MKAEDSRKADANLGAATRNVAGAGIRAEAGPTTRRRTKAEWAQGGGLMEAVCERGNLMPAYDRVLKNKGVRRQVKLTP
ncbi:hypothetical protein [Desulfosoma sp.]